MPPKSDWSFADHADRPYPYSGFETIQGRRWNMEDAHIDIDDMRATYPSLETTAERLSLYAVFDGHGGKRAALFAEEHFVDILIAQPAFKAGQYLEGMAAAFIECDRQLIAALTATPMPAEAPSEPALLSAAAATGHGPARPPTHGPLGTAGNDGSTALVVLIADRIAYCANAGDSEAILGRRVTDASKNSDFKPSVMSQKHNPSVESEKTRLEKAGATVAFNRVGGMLAVSRGFGDKEFKAPFNNHAEDFVLARPYVSTATGAPEEEFIILACDGLWDTVTYDQAVEIVAGARWNALSPMQAAEKLVTEALDTKSTDNITCIVVYLVAPLTREKKKAQAKEQS